MKGLSGLLTSSEFLARFEGTFDAVFTCTDTCWFRERDWRKVLLPYGMNLGHEEFRGVQRVADGVGDTRMIVTSAETLPRHDVSIFGDLSFEALAAIRTGTILGHVDCCVFGPSGKWGIICSNRDDYAIYGVEPQSAEAFVTEAGGEDLLKDRFLEFANSEWMLPLARQQELLREVGWAH